MIPNNIIFKQINTGAVMLVLFGFVAGLRAEGITLLRPKKPAGATRILSFPSGQCMGNLYLEPESGPGWDPKRVTLSGQWQYLSAAQGDVGVPEDRNIKLWIQLALSPRESAKLRAQDHLAHRLLIADRVRKDPDDLSGLLELDPNDLFRLSVSSAMHLRTGADPRIFEPISRLTGLQMLGLKDTGVTDKGFEHLRSLRSLRVLVIGESSITSRGLAVLMDLPALVYLDLNMGVTDAGLRQVGQHPNLRWLRIRTGKIWGPGLAELANMPRLERLCIWGSSPISDRHVKYMEGLTQLKSLTLWGVDALTDASLASIGKLKNLEELYFIHTSPRFSVAGAAHLKKLKNLKKIAFAQIMWSRYAGYNGDEVVRYLTALPDLESIEGLRYLSAEGMKTLTRFRNLKCLGVALKDRGQGYSGPTGISHLFNLGSLEELHITGSESLSDADLASLELLGRLKELHIGSRHLNLSDRILTSIGKLKNLESLHLSCPVNRSGLNQLNGLSNLHTLQVNARGNAAKTNPADELMLDLSGLKNMKDMNLTRLPLQNSDLAFLEHLPLLENLSIQPIQTDYLTGSFLRHLRELPELNCLYVSELLGCTGEELAHLNGLPKLRSLTLKGDITDTDLASLTGPLSLESIRVETDEPIRKQTVTDLTKSHPVIEYIHINELPKVQARPVRSPKRTRISQPRTNRQTQQNRRRRR
ncbi:MAG: hypothetical protein FVQ84_06015 [Planctomycetes bacterium]|nr:hypothetical protein [Planctomycetota bacterium]